MPFTVSHVIAVLPLRQRWSGLLPTAPLVVASMVPDLPTAVGFPDLRARTHALSAVLTIDVGLTALLCLAWVCWVRTALADLAPGLQARWQPPGPARRGAAARAGQLAGWYAAAVLGGFTHLLWDALTHPGDGLARHLLAHPFQHVDAFFVLQMLSSVLGLVVLVGWSVRWWRSRAPQQPITPVVRRRPALVALGAVAGTAALFATWKGLAATTDPVAQWRRAGVLVEAVFGGLTGVLVAVLLLAIGHQVLGRARRPHRRGQSTAHPADVVSHTTSARSRTGSVAK